MSPEETARRLLIVARHVDYARQELKVLEGALVPGHYDLATAHKLSEAATLLQMAVTLLRVPRRETGGPQTTPAAANA